MEFVYGIDSTDNLNIDTQQNRPNNVLTSDPACKNLKTLSIKISTS